MPSQNDILLLENPEDEDVWGWFPGTSTLAADTAKLRDAVRNAWFEATYQKRRCYKCSKKKMCVRPGKVLFEWNNPNPSEAVKSYQHDEASATTMAITSSIGGFRIIDHCGNIRVEFMLLFSYGSVTYMAWKYYSEFAALYEVINHIHKTVAPLFYEALAQWEFYIKSKKRWFRSFSVPYLIEKSVYMGKFIQAVLYETSSPGLLIDFVQNSQSFV